MKRAAPAGVGCAFFLCLPALAADRDAGASGNTAWVLTASALVLFMTLPGLALFYGGLVRARNMLSVMMHCFAICCIVSLIWLAFGYSVVFTNGSPLPTAARYQRQPAARLLGQALSRASRKPAVTGRHPGERLRDVPDDVSALWTAAVYLPVAHWV